LRRTYGTCGFRSLSGEPGGGCGQRSDRKDFRTGRTGSRRRNRTMQAKGRVFKYGDKVDTDVIIPARYLNSADAAEMATHCMEDIDKDFVHKVHKGDIIVADKNFGCGSSREHAPIAIKAAGVSCVIAETFARIFYRNAINI